ncbi:tRNA (adenosine(37)-N6)-threonylcarbamoyltransferase complex ATPase subunit type 1 TsaE [Asticcacaulis sp. EMRT-3]|uniref:tRNA (adenosine(37)-N6)-threonylcarbamoyltransferase complex ATPase subunit type 1 TsaE n=1 Tax=Asticcacaulis sp. EMRT-3 TaxID=3040349 RepID=UPI0024AFE8A2|nr:tRNA (adenosine(37)-N6)-threonylcarbamoyltransferase complex ATPase subunit type 1 TsaE [Asticcacaulis sp. EMRT-3]MDI7775892.1 tRNA (adenosine(37)-N6)-threonylcarbamoyltransferase complex ATPase subunit type 1 TsaE [Asticcacaulis sp. EMRT-3]
MADIAHNQHLHLADEAATMNLGAAIAPQLKAGDVVYLTGALGMGKSSLARGLIRALTHPDQEVPSPTFTLMQIYETPAFDIWHLDLYRLPGPEEVHELGLDEALAGSVLLIEWPDRLGHLGFDDRLEISLEQDDKTNFPQTGHGRIATLTPCGRFRDRL